jgi:outer membrane protein assembly factor BamD (BamD/ComL family)
MNSRIPFLTLRILAALIVVAALGAFIAQAHALPDPASIALLGPLGYLASAVGIAAVLWELSSRSETTSTPSPSTSATNSLSQAQLVELAFKVEELTAAVNRVKQQLESTTPGTTPASAPSPDVLNALQRLFEELRDLSLLTDDQRRERAQQLREQRKAAELQSVGELIQDRHWNQATAAIADLEQQWPGDPDVLALRQSLNAGLSAEERETITTAAAQIETEMSLSHWTAALSAAQDLAHRFPANDRATKLLHRVEREKHIYTETAVNRLFEEIRHNIDRRIWRRALTHTQELLSKFPDHPKTDLIRKQSRTIQDNAEIEERQEQEKHIRQLIQSRRFREAIDLSEELLRRFPLSPQAQAIQKILPRIKQLLADEEATTPKRPASPT